MREANRSVLRSYRPKQARGTALRKASAAKVAKSTASACKPQEREARRRRELNFCEKGEAQGEVILLYLVDLMHREKYGTTPCMPSTLLVQLPFQLHKVRTHRDGMYGLDSGEPIENAPFEDVALDGSMHNFMERDASSPSKGTQADVCPDLWADLDLPENTKSCRKSLPRTFKSG